MRPYASWKHCGRGTQRLDYDSAIGDTGIKVSMIDALTHGLPGVPAPEDSGLRHASTDATGRTLPAGRGKLSSGARALGAKILNVVAYRGQVVPVREMADAINGICRRAATLGIQVALEFLPESGIPDIHRARQILEACNQHNLGLMLDVFHLGRSGGTVNDVAPFRPGAIASIQISDRDPSNAEHVPYRGRLMPGEGQLPLRELVTAALENNPAATLDIEVLNAELSGLPADEAAGRLAARSFSLARGVLS